MNTLSLSEIAAKIAEMYELPKNKAKAIVSNVFDQIKGQVIAGGDVRIHKFGSFKKTKRSSRQGVSPQGTKWMKPACTAMTFRSAKAIKDSLN